MKYTAIYICIALLVSCYGKSSNKRLMAISKLPAFKILSTDSSTWVDTDKLNLKGPAIFIYFSPDCEHCQKEAEDIVTHQSQLDHTKIYFLSTDSLPIINKFSKYYHLDTMRNVFVGQDYKYSFYNKYRPSETPYVVIYNRNKNLIKAYSGDTNINSIINSSTTATQN